MGHGLGRPRAGNPDSFWRLWRCCPRDSPHLSQGDDDADNTVIADLPRPMMTAGAVADRESDVAGCRRHGSPSQNLRVARNFDARPGEAGRSAIEGGAIAEEAFSTLRLKHE